LGHIVSKKGIAAMDPKKIVAIKGWLASKNISKVRSFMGLNDY
jgi:hypothetical protein